MKPMIVLSTLMLASIAVAQAPDASSIFKRLDVNQDSFLSKTEVKDSRLARRFDALDLDRDSKLSLAELQAARPDARAPFSPGFAGADTNKDGLISKAEATQSLNQRFDAADTNKDGNLSKDELSAAREARGGGRHRNDR